MFCVAAMGVPLEAGMPYSLVHNEEDVDKMYAADEVLDIPERDGPPHFRTGEFAPEKVLKVYHKPPKDPDRMSE